MADEYVSWQKKKEAGNLCKERKKETSDATKNLQQTFQNFDAALKIRNKMSRDMRFYNNVVCGTSKASDQPAHMQVWSEPLLVPWIFYEC